MDDAGQVLAETALGYHGLLSEIKGKEECSSLGLVYAAGAAGKML